MACPHGTGAPAACSQCLGAAARHVTHDGPIAFIDGIPERPFEPPPPRNGLRAQIKGGRERALRSAPRTRRV